VWQHAVALVDVVIYSWAEAPQSATKTQKHNPISQGSIWSACYLRLAAAIVTPLARSRSSNATGPRAATQARGKLPQGF
jgi:hypothetical protein